MATSEKWRRASRLSSRSRARRAGSPQPGQRASPVRRDPCRRRAQPRTVSSCDVTTLRQVLGSSTRRRHVARRGSLPSSTVPMHSTTTPRGQIRHLAGVRQVHGQRHGAFRSTTAVYERCDELTRDPRRRPRRPSRAGGRLVVFGLVRAMARNPVVVHPPVAPEVRGLR